MKKISYILLYSLILFVTACEKDTMPDTFAPEVTTGTATNIYRKGATLSGSITLAEGSMAEQYGILFSTLSSMAEYQEFVVMDGKTDFSIPIQNLEPGRTYYFCTFAYSGYSLHTGEIRSFTTTRNNAPVFDILNVAEVTANSIKISVNLLDDGDSELIMAGFCYNEVGENEPTFLDRVVNVTPNGNSFVAEIVGLESGKAYQIRVYGANENGLAYSDDMLTVFTEEAIVPPVDSDGSDIENIPTHDW